MISALFNAYRELFRVATMFLLLRSPDLGNSLSMTERSRVIWWLSIPILLVSGFYAPSNELIVAIVAHTLTWFVIRFFPMYTFVLLTISIVGAPLGDAIKILVPQLGIPLFLLYVVAFVKAYCTLKDRAR